MYWVLRVERKLTQYPILNTQYEETMCWSIPGKIINIKGNIAEVEIGGARRNIKLDLIDAPAVGEYVLVHAGYAIQKVNEENAKFTIQLLQGGV